MPGQPPAAGLVFPDPTPVLERGNGLEWREAGWIGAVTGCQVGLPATDIRSEGSPVSHGSPEPGQSLDSILLEFDQAWHSRGGASIEDWLRRVDPSGRSEALGELVKIDLQYQWSRGSGRRVENYLADYPELASVEGIWEELVEEELIARRRAGDAPGDLEFSSRFAGRAEEVRGIWHSVCRQHSPRSQSKPCGPGAGSSGLTGTTLAGRYQVREPIGQGAHADVYCAWDPVLSREVAVKVSRWSMEEGSGAARRFLREAESIAQLQHPGIVSVYEFGRHGSRLYIVEELLSDGTLEKHLDRGPVDVVQAVNWLREICHAVDYAHQCGVIHRDLKPANVLIDRHGRLRVGDFGLAARSEGDLRLTHEGEMLGTPAYMSPEQIHGDGGASPASDVYALGAILYQMLAGRLPFSGPTASVLHQVLEGNPVRPRKLNPRIPVELETLCLKAMAREPGRRYSSVRDLAEDLRRFLASEPLLARRTGWWGQMRLWVRRQPVAAAVALSSLVLIAAILAAGFLRVTEERNRFRGERDRANEALFQSLMGNIRNELRSKAGGWYSRATETLAKAAQSPAAAAERDSLRDLAGEVLLDPGPRLELQATLTPSPLPSQAVGGSGPVPSPSVPALAIDAPRGLVLAGSASGGLFLHRWQKNARMELKGPGEPVLDVDLSRERALALCGEELWSWPVEGLESAAGDLPAGSLEGALLVGGIRCFAYSPEKSQLACGYEDGRIALFRLDGTRTGELTVWKAHEGEVNGLAFSRDGLLCASGGQDGFVKCWEVPAGLLLAGYLGANIPRSLDFGFDGNSLVWTCWETFSLTSFPLTGSVSIFGGWTAAFRAVAEIGDQEHLTISTDGQVMHWKLRRPVTSVASGGEPVSLAVSAADRTLAVGFANGEIRVWQIVGSDLTRRLRTHQPMDLDSQGHPYDHLGRLDASRPLEHLSWFRVNHTQALDTGMTVDFVATANGQGELQVYSGGGVRSTGLGHPGRVVSLSVGNSDRWIVTTDAEGPVRIWDRESLEKIGEIPSGRGRIFRIACDPDNGSVVVAGRSGTELVAENGSRTVLNPNAQFAGAMAFGRSSLAVSLSDGRVGLFSRDGQEQLALLPSQKQVLLDLAFSPDGERLYCLSASHDIACWDWRNGQLLRKSAPDLGSHGLVVDPLGKYLLALTHHSRALVFDARSLERVAQISLMRGHGGFSPDGSLFRHSSFGLQEFRRGILDAAVPEGGALGAQESALRADFVQVVPGGHLDTVWSVDVSPDDRWTATGSFDQTVKIWDNASGELVSTTGQHAGMVWRVRFSSDSALVASGSENEAEKKGEILLTRPESGEVCGRLEIGTRLIGGMDFHPDRPWLAVSCFDGHVGIADSGSLEWLATAQPFRQAILDIRFSPEGDLLAAACLGNGLALWKTGTDSAGKPGPLENPELLVEPGERVWAVAFSEDGKLLASACESGTIVIYERATLRRVLALKSGCSRLRYLRFSPDGNRLWCSAFASEGCVIELDRLRERLKQMDLDW